MKQPLLTIQWKNDKLILLDQTLLPKEIIYNEYDSLESVREAIRVMKVRGAPAIGVAAAYGVYLGIKDASENSYATFFETMEKKTSHLATARPTAVNLFWAINRMKSTAEKNQNVAVSRIKRILLEEAISIHKEDEEINRLIGVHLLSLLKEDMGVLTHCNAGALATTKYGTATAPMYLAKENGWDLKIYSCETRPRLQGSTLTALELQQAGIDVTVITDSMAAVVMAEGKIDAIIVGADRVAANGDVANKVGTLNLSILAKHFGIPFYVAVPTPTIDSQTKAGKEIPIENRNKEEIIKTFGEYTAPADVSVYNPAFDVTPNENITAIITEKGILKAPYTENIQKLFN